MPKKLFVGNLNYHTKDNNLRKAFESYGEITEAKVIIDHYRRRSRGYGFVTFVHEEDAKTAISKMNGVKVDGRYINVEEAQEKSPRKDSREAGSIAGIMTTENRKVSKGQIFLTIVYVFLISTFLLYLSGDWLWIEGWLFGIWLVALSLGTTCYLYRRDPSLLAERFKMPGAKGQKGWDKYFLYFFIAAFFAWIAIMPLDAKKYEWTKTFPTGLKVLGGIVLLLCAFFMFRALAENTFASTLVRIQTERKQRVVSTGVYSIVRHPMYLGGLLLFIGAPLMLGSIYGLIAGGVISLLLAGRIVGEERMLTKELEGYQEYKKRVKYRLIPFVW